VVRDFSLLMLLVSLSATYKVNAGVDSVKAIDEALKISSYILPTEKLRCVASKVRDVVRPSAYGGDFDVGVTNAGFRNRYQELLDKDPCFHQVATSFWEDVNRMVLPSLVMPADSKVIHYAPKLSGQPVPRPTLGECAGEGRYSDFKPGWLWEKAMATTGRDPALALNLLTMCLNDDRAQALNNQLSVEESAAQFEREIAIYERGLEKIRHSIEGLDRLSTEWQSAQSGISFYESRLSDVKNKLERRERLQGPPFNCPSSASVAYAQQSVDASFELPSDVKASVVASEKPHGTAFELPAKSYHFVAAAALGCAVSQCGLSIENTGRAAGAVISAYRVIRLCPHVATLLEQPAALAKQYGIDENDPKLMDKLRERFRANARILGSGGVGWSGLIGDPPSTAEQKAEIERLINWKIEEMDAAILYKKWYWGGPGFSLPCTAWRGGPKDLTSNDPSRDPSKSLCGNWTVDRCKTARLKLSSWEVDTNWQKTQFEIGAAFGAKKCADSAASNWTAPNFCSLPGATTSPRQTNSDTFK
jgi:hypothetical protein